MATVTLDSVGRLRTFIAVPRQTDPPNPTHEPNWQELFQAAGLDISRFKAAPPRWLPVEPFDIQRGWDGSYENDRLPVHVLAASYHGRPVVFRVIAPWINEPEWAPGGKKSARNLFALTIIVVGGVALVLLASFVARKNVRLGRGDRKGAFRLASSCFVLGWAAKICLSHHVVDLGREFNLIVLATAQAFFTAAIIWIYYMALEPYVRRTWPEYLISWTRLLGGNYRDAMVGRDLLTGSLIGSLIALIVHVVNALPAWFNLAGQTPINGD
ncbi:MAG TPA: hypothetical protein VG498_05560, partial [Terriglobales bacterium]|nr:hypothetical protein [Terriglobales bacterium]